MVSDTEYYEGLWSYYQDFCKTHNATGISDLVVQRDNAIAKVAELEAEIEWLNKLPSELQEIRNIINDSEVSDIGYEAFKILGKDNEQLRIKVAELQSSHNALEAKLAKFKNLEPVAYGWFEEGDVKALAFSDMPYTPKYSPDAVKKPLYALEMK